MRLAALKKVDFQRVIFLRTGSNFSMPPAGQTDRGEHGGEYAGHDALARGRWRVGSGRARPRQGLGKYSVGPPQ